MRFATSTLMMLCMSVGVLMPSWVDALTFSPDRFESNLSPGVSHVEQLTVFNETGETSSVSLTPTPLEILDADNGLATFQTNAPSPRWLEVSSSRFVLEPGEQRTVDVTMQAPLEASGSLLAGIAIRFRPVRSDQTENISIEGMTGPFIFATVEAPDSTREGAITAVTPIGGSLVSGLPVTLAVSFANTGNVLLQPLGTLEARTMWGHLIARVPFNEEALTVLPATERQFLVTWDRQAKESTSWSSALSWLPRIGPVHLTAEMVVGDHVESATTIVWLLPWKVLLLVGGLLGLVLLIRRRTRRVRL